jgi:4,5-dihydroxyphthalate decarboxylase
MRATISIAISDYDHVRDMLSGAAAPDGIDLIPFSLPVEEIFHRFLFYREWDVCELSFAKYVSKIAARDADFTAIPVFPSRMFRISSMYVRADCPIRSPEQLAGKRVGIPEWAQTAAVYTRGWLAETVGIPLADIEWFQAGVNDRGRAEKVSLELPSGIRLTPVPTDTLTNMLRTGQVDAVFSARPPAPIVQNTGEFRHLVEDFQASEQDYFNKTNIFPIMHAIVVRNAVLEKHPWVAQDLQKAFAKARSNSIARLHDLTASRVPLPWGPIRAKEAEAVFGDLFPYGVEANRPTLETFLRFAYDQGVINRRLQVEELFVPSTLTSYRV